MSDQIKISFKDYLSEIYDKPAKLHEAYRLFRKYSFRNRILAARQLIELEPINTYKGWKDLGRQVKKGSKAIALFLPVVSKKKDKEDEDDIRSQTNFILRKHWFSLSQTEGKEFASEPLPNFDIQKVLETLGITQEKFRNLNGNCQGYAIPNKNIIAINPLAYAAYRTTIHEIAHCLLHKESDKIIDEQQLDSSVMEFEAETTAYLVCCSLGKFDHLKYSRGYIANWINKEDVAEESFRRAFDAANKILAIGAF